MSARRSVSGGKSGSFGLQIRDSLRRSGTAKAARTAVIFLCVFGAGCSMDIRNNEPSITFVSQRSLDAATACLLAPMNAEADRIIPPIDISRVLGTAQGIVNQVRVMEPGKINEIGPLQSNWSTLWTL